MPSPFPGMDPYLEASGVWGDFHSGTLTYGRDAIDDQLPDGYVARIDERFSLVEVPYEPAKVVRPDVVVVSGPPDATRQAPSTPGAAVLEPVTIPFPTDWVEVREIRVEILDRFEHELVTAIELLSPTNKVDPGRVDYLSKRRGLLNRRVNLVEIDLLLGGRRLPMARPLPAGDYYAFVARGDRFPVGDVYAWSIRQPLPTIPVPLRAPDPDLWLDLSGVVASAYRRGRYDRSIKYGRPLALPLNAEDRAWAEGRGSPDVR